MYFLKQMARRNGVTDAILIQEKCFLIDHFCFNKIFYMLDLPKIYMYIQICKMSLVICDIILNLRYYS